MTVESNVLRIETREEGEMLDITEKVQSIVGKGTVKSGVAFLFVPGSIAALTTIEYEPGLLTYHPCWRGLSPEKARMNMRDDRMMETATLTSEFR